MLTYVADNRRFWLDPRTKGLLLLIINIIVFQGSVGWNESLVFGFMAILLGLNGLFLQLLGFGAIYVVVMVVDGVAGFFPEMLGAVWTVFSRMIHVYLPFLMMVYLLISTTKISELVVALESLRMPKCVIIPITVLFRFFPTVREEWMAINKAMKLRGIGLSVRNALTKPLTMLEYIFVPLLFSLVKIGEELSAAALTRGLGSDVKRTHLVEIGFCLRDWLVLVAATLMLVVTVFN